MPSSTEAKTHDRSNGAHGVHASKTMEPMSFHDGLSGHDLDDSILVRLGKKPVLKRNFGYMSILGFSCTILITWESTMFLFAQGFQNGGPAGVVYGYLLVWVGTLSTFATLSELASMLVTPVSCHAALS
jgi:choline transport protein